MLCELAQQYKKLSGTEAHHPLLCRNFIKYVAPNMMVLLVCILLFLLRVPEGMAAPTPQGFEEEMRQAQQEQAQAQVQANASTTTTTTQQPQSQASADAPAAPAQATNKPRGSSIQPQGFDSHSSKRASPRGFGIDNSPSPNTIQGVLHNALSDDYVLLEGSFVLQQKGSKSIYQFTDASGDCINVDIATANNTKAPLLGIKYYLWGKIERDWFSTSINVIEFTPKG